MTNTLRIGGQVVTVGANGPAFALVFEHGQPIRCISSTGDQDELAALLLELPPEWQHALETMGPAER